MAISKESFNSKGSEPGFSGSEKLWNRNFPEPGMKRYREIRHSNADQSLQFLPSKFYNPLAAYCESHSEMVE